MPQKIEEPRLAGGQRSFDRKAGLAESDDLPESDERAQDAGVQREAD